jgi:hypothetical protein
MNKIFILALGLLPTFLETRAHAYIDPGSGSFLFQIMVASLVGAGFAVKAHWTRIKTFIKNLFQKKTP